MPNIKSENFLEADGNPGVRIGVGPGGAHHAPHLVMRRFIRDEDVAGVSAARVTADSWRHFTRLVKITILLSNFTQSTRFTRFKRIF